MGVSGWYMLKNKIFGEEMEVNREIRKNNVR